MSRRTGEPLLDAVAQVVVRVEGDQAGLADAVAPRAQGDAVGDRVVAAERDQQPALAHAASRPRSMTRCLALVARPGRRTSPASRRRRSATSTSCAQEYVE